MSPKGMRGRAIVVYLDPDMKEQFQKKTQNQGRKMNTVIAKMVEGYVKGEISIKGWA